jgi:hypothetical protein
MQLVIEKSQKPLLEPVSTGTVSAMAARAVARPEAH